MSKYEYDAEKLLLVGDWYHRQADAVFDWYQDPGHYANEVRINQISSAGSIGYDSDADMYFFLACTRLYAYQRRGIFQLLHGSQIPASRLQERYKAISQITKQRSY